MLRPNINLFIDIDEHADRSGGEADARALDNARQRE
jgi:hypothetical protein